MNNIGDAYIAQVEAVEHLNHEKLVEMLGLELNAQIFASRGVSYAGLLAPPMDELIALAKRSWRFLFKVIYDILCDDQAIPQNIRKEIWGLLQAKNQKEAIAKIVGYVVTIIGMRHPIAVLVVTIIVDRLLSYLLDSLCDTLERIKDIPLVSNESSE